MRSPLLPIFLTVLVDVLGLTIVLPLLPRYAEDFGATPFVATLIASSYAVCQLLASPLLGSLSDRIGRKPTLLASQAGSFVGFLILANANALWLVFLGRIIDGATAGNLTIAQAYISDVTKPENRSKAFGVIGIAFAIGFLVGPAFSGYSAAHYGHSVPFYVAAALSATSVLLTATLLPNVKPVITREREPHLAAFKRLFGMPLVRRRFGEFFLFSMAFSMLMSGLALFLEHRFHYDVAQAGWVYTFSALVGGMVQGPMMGRLVKRYGEPALTRFGFITMAIGYLVLGVADGMPLLLVAAGISSIGSSLLRPCITTLLTKSVSKSEQGATLGASQSLQSIAQIISPMIAGYLIGRALVGVYGIAAATPALLGFALTLRPTPPGPPEESAEEAPAPATPASTEGATS
jgi:MFS family permease